MREKELPLPTISLLISKHNNKKSMKKFTLIMSLLIATLAVNAIPAKRGVWKNLKLADGTEVRAQLVGDEHFHFWKAENGETYVLGQNKQVYEKANLSKLKFNADQRRQRMAERRQARLAKLKNMSEQTGRRKVNERFHGTKKGLVILVNFTDTKFKAAHNQALYNRICNEQNFTSAEGFKGSVRDYFKAQSFGVFDLQFDVVGPVTLANGYAYYGADNDAKANEMIIEACKGADAQVNFADYDWDGDGEVDQVFVLYAGKGEADNDDTNLVWPHEHQLTGYGTEESPAEALTLDGVKIDTYACANEITALGTIDGIGTFCHEFSHCLGYPDMYDTSYQGYYGMGQFDLMDGGAYNGDGFVPAGYTSWERMIAGWLDPIELNNQDQAVTGMKAINEGGEAYIMYNQANKNEYFLLENRQKKGFDAELPDEGLLIMHVDYDAEKFANNVVNTLISKDDLWNEALDYYAEFYYTGEMTEDEVYAACDEYAEEYYPIYGNDHQRMTIMHADNDDDQAYYDPETYSYSKQTVGTDLYPITGNNVFDNNSQPAARLHYANNDGKRYLNHGLEDITQNADGTISFNFKAKSVKEYPEIGTVLLNETFDKCAGTGGNDGKWSGSIASAAFNPDLDGWEIQHTTDWQSFEEGKGYGGNKCARFGTNRMSPVVLSPLFNLEGKATLTFKIAPWGSDGKGLEIYLENNDTQDYILLTEEGEEMTAGQWNDYTFEIEGDGSNYFISFYPDKRIFLDEVKAVYTEQPVTTGIKNVNGNDNAKKSNRIYTIDGRYMGTNMNSLQRGIYIVNGKKIVK